MLWELRVDQETVDAGAKRKDRLELRQGFEQARLRTKAERIVDVVGRIAVLAFDQDAHVAARQRFIPIVAPAGGNDQKEIGGRIHRDTLTRFASSFKAVYFAAGFAASAALAGAGIGAGESSWVLR